MSNFKLTRPIVMAVILALGLGLLVTQLNSRAQTITCSASNLVDVTLSSGARWQMCWETRTLEGIAIPVIALGEFPCEGGIRDLLRRKVQ